MRAVASDQGVIASPVHGIGKTWARGVADKAEILTPGISQLPGETVSLPHRDLRLQRMVIVTAHVGEHVRREKLRVGRDKVLGESVLPQNLSLNARRRGQVAVICV